jgi:hypothetical protein
VRVIRCEPELQKVEVQVSFAGIVDAHVKSHRVKLFPYPTFYTNDEMTYAPPGVIPWR